MVDEAIKEEWIASLPEPIQHYACVVTPQFLGDPFGKEKWTRAAERRAEVAKMVIRGYSQEELSRRIGCSARTIANDLKFLWTQWREEQQDFLNRATALQLRQLDLVIKEAWEAWERSIGDVVEVTESENDKTGSTRTVKTKTQAGNPQYLTKVLDSLGQRAALLGINAPERFEVTETRKYKVQIQNLSRKEKEVLAGMVDKGVPLQLEKPIDSQTEAE